MKKLSKNTKFIIVILLSLIVLTSVCFIFLNYNLHIPSNMKLVKMIFTDYLSLNHYLLSSTANIFEIEINDYISHNDTKRTTDYSFVIKNGDLAGKEAIITYPGTPQKQYYGLPRLSKNERYILITVGGWNNYFDYNIVNIFILLIRYRLETFI